MKAGDRTTEGATTERTQNQLTHVQSLQATGKTREDPEPATWANGDRKRPRGSRADETRQATAMEREDGNKTPKSTGERGPGVLGQAQATDPTYMHSRPKEKGRGSQIFEETAQIFLHLIKRSHRSKKHRANHVQEGRSMQAPPGHHGSCWGAARGTAAWEDSRTRGQPHAGTAAWEDSTITRGPLNTQQKGDKVTAQGKS